MKHKFYCSDCGMEAIIEITDNPWEAEDEDIVNACFHCGSDGARSKDLDEE